MQRFHILVNRHFSYTSNPGENYTLLLPTCTFTLINPQPSTFTKRTVLHCLNAPWTHNTLQCVLAVKLTFTAFSLSCRRHVLFRRHLACLIGVCSWGFLMTGIFFLFICFLFRSFLVEIRSGTMLHRRSWILFGIFRRLRISLCNCPDEGRQKSKTVHTLCNFKSSSIFT